MMVKKFSELSMKNQEKFVEYLMEIKSVSEKFVIEIVKGTNIELNTSIASIKNFVEQLETVSLSK